MISKIKNIFSSEIARGSFFLVLGTFIFNILNYIFHFSMARMLGPADYGVLASLMSIIYFFSIPTETIQATVARYTAIFNVRNEHGKIKSLMRRAIRKSWKFGIIGIAVFIAISPLIKKFLNFDSIVPLIWLSLFIPFVLLVPVLRGILQGVKKFKALGLNVSLEGLIKLILALFLVFIGLGINGTIIAIIIASCLVFILAFYFLKNITKIKEKYFDKKEIYSYSIPVFIALICLTTMYSMDVIIAKHFFSEIDAGIYAVASLLGKMILFSLIPIAKAMFPIIAERKEEYGHIFKKSLWIAIIISGIALLVYYLLPKLIISILFGKQYLAAASILFYLGAAFTLMTLSYLIVFYNLSLGKKKIIWTLPFFTAGEIIILSLFNSSMVQFSVAFMIINFVICLSLILLNKK
jgi:O-antigen/teichoic acid export membrane protein